jgi:CheY-like chemotaxis protein
MAKTILIAAADPNIHYLLQRYAETSGFHTVSVADGNGIWDSILQAQPDLIVLENELPEAPAWQVLRWLKDTPVTHDIPVVVYSYTEEDLCIPVEGVAYTLQKSMMYSDFLTALDRAGLHQDGGRAAFM